MTNLERTDIETDLLDLLDLLEPVAAGAHGQVWRARLSGSGHLVAVKLMDGPRAAFEREATAIARMHHPHIVPILDMGRRVVDGVEQSFLVMPWAEDGTLASAVDVDVVSVARQLLDALAHAHARGVLHLDLKPANALMFGRDVRLTDFSIARLGDAPVDRLRGTPRYMAPEQFTGVALGPWTDRYGLGCLLYELLSGQPPFVGHSHDAMARLHEIERPAPLPDTVPPALAAVVFQLLAKAPEDRFGSDREARTALEQAVASPRGAPAVQQETLTVTSTLGGPRTRADAGPGSGRTGAITLPPPRDWRIAAQPVARRSFPIGRSVALLRLRSSATVGRARERDVLWNALCGVSASGRAAAVVLTGPPGVGLSHLARWIRIHAVELGVAVAVPLGEAVPDGALGVVVVDDATREDQQRVLAALASPARGPALYVLVCRERRHPAFEAFGATELEVEPFTRAEHAQFLDGLIHVDATMGAALYEHAAGLAERTVRLAARILRDGDLRPRANPMDVVGVDRAVLQVVACFEGPAPLEDWAAGCAVRDVPDPHRRLPLLSDLVREVRGHLVLTDPDVRMALLEDAGPTMAAMAEAGVGSPRQRGRWWVRAGEGVRGARMLLDVGEQTSRTRGTLFRPLLGWIEEGLDAGRAGSAGAATDADRQRLTYLRVCREVITLSPTVKEWFTTEAFRALPEDEQAVLRAYHGFTERRFAELRDEALRVLERPDGGPVRPFVAVQACYFGGIGAGMAGDAVRMQQLFRRGAWTAAAAGLFEWSAACLSDIAGWSGRLGVPGGAMEYARMALITASEHGFDELAGYARINLGEALQSAGDAQGAAHHFAAAERELEACGSIASAHARMLRLLLQIDEGRSLRVEFSHLKTLFDSFRTGADPAAHCAVAEAVCAYRDGDVGRGNALCRAVCERLCTGRVFTDLLPLLGRLRDQTEPTLKARLTELMAEAS